MNTGFLGTAGPRYADVVLLLEIGMGMALLIGTALARMRRFKAHACCQSMVVLFNFSVILLVMVPSFRSDVGPRIPHMLGKAYYGVATAHAALGAVAELAALYVLLSAGTKLLPERFRITRYKLWMRSVLVIWWAVLLLGIATYARWYVPHSIARSLCNTNGRYQNVSNRQSLKRIRVQNRDVRPARSPYIGRRKSENGDHRYADGRS